LIQIDLSDKHVLITGGTKGIGYAAAKNFGAAGARVFLTYKWGSADMDEIRKDFKKLNAPEPIFIQADVSVDEDTVIVMDTIAGHTEKLDIFISNVGYAAKMDRLEDYKKRSFFKTLEYSSWPIVEYTRAMKKKFGVYPEYVIGTSSDGPDHYYRGYDFVAASKAVLEFFGKYLAAHLGPEGSKVNIIRFGMVKTESFQLIFGEEFFTYLQEEEGVTEEMLLTPKDCGKSILALCSGLMDAVNGQIINVDHGLPFRDNTMMRYLQRQTST
jgi:enoyl-[acyl-carrier-protein] reductase (NADH)